MINNKGITLLILVITVVVMLILISATTYIGLETYRNAKLTEFTAYMQAIQKEVDNIVQKNANIIQLGSSIAESNKSSEIQNIVSLAEANSEIRNTDLSNTNLRYFNSQDISEDLELDNIKDEIIVNFETREVISLNGINYNNQTYYTQYNLPNGQQIVNYASSETIRDLSFETSKEINGLTAVINIENIQISNGTLSYRQTEGSWQIITNYTQRGNSYQTEKISKTGTYEFKLTDNVTGESNTQEPVLELKLTNEPKLETGETLNNTEYDYSANSASWAYKTVLGTTYVWIPRFAYKNENNIQTIIFLKETSSIGTDNTFIDNSYTIPAAFFDESNNEISGKWIDVNSQNQNALDIIALTET